jgi:hypothetical protein
MRRFFWIGLAIWLAATLAIRFGGSRLIPAGYPGRLALVFGATGLLIGVFLFRLVRALPTPEAGLRAAVLIVLPGLLLDTGSVLWFRSVFPNLPDSAGMPFAALLLWCYGIALLAALLAGKGVTHSSRS